MNGRIRSRVQRLVRARRLIYDLPAVWAIKRSDLHDSAWYLANNPDVRAAGINTALHYLRHGASEGREPGPFFSGSDYLARNPDVKSAGINPLVHYLRHGRHEDRKYGPVRALAQHAPVLERTLNEVRVPAWLSEQQSYIDSHRRYTKWNSDLENQFLGEIQRHYAQEKDRYDAVLASIVMPTYNRAETISRAIDSIIRQTHGNWQLIIIDDGSTDHTRTVLDPYLSDPRISYIKQANSGVSSARNAGLDAAQGQFVFYLDSDNIWYENHLRSLIVYMEKAGLKTAYCGLRCMGDQGERFFRGTDFLWEACHKLNYIDLNCFAHRNFRHRNFRFDTQLKRLVDWEFILNLTKFNRTAYAPFLGVEYYDGGNGARITHTQHVNGDLPKLMEAIRNRHVVDEKQLVLIREIHQPQHSLQRLLDTTNGGIPNPPRIGYVVWDWPAMSQTFVINEVRWLVEHGIDVKVYYHVAPDKSFSLDFAVDQYQVKDANELSALLRQHQRTALHSPFAYPATTLLTWPAAEAVDIPFTFMPGGVDISHHTNRKRNRIAEVTASANCAGVITLGSYHRDFLISSGVPSNKIVMERQAVGLPEFKPRPRTTNTPLNIVSVGRFVEKKGFKYLIDAAPYIKDAVVTIYGYGPEEQSLARQIEQLGTSNIKLERGPSTIGELHEIYHSADLFVLPCVQAENGDLDGLPTVLLEAMAAGVPVLSSKIANIPDLVIDGVTGHLADPESPLAIAEAIERFRQTPDQRLAQLIEDANQKARSYASVDQTMATLLDCLSKRPIHIFLVTYDNEKYRNIVETSEIINRIYKFTSMPFRLTIVDNNSDDSFKKSIKNQLSSKKNSTFIELPENIFCGPASNIALDRCESEYAIYICSKEGFILKHGWEREIVRAMDRHPNAAMGGHLLPLAKHATGEQIQSYPSFGSWRNKEYAQNNPDKLINHVQGGFYILRRRAFVDVGGFNELVPQDGMDVEYSYYLLSCGYELLDLPMVASVSNKTLPRALSLVDENTIFVHPSTHAQVSNFDRISSRQTMHCGCCGWQGTSFTRNNARSDEDICPNCASTGFGRTVWRTLSYSGRLQTRPDAVVLSEDAGLVRALKTICRRVERLTPDKSSLSSVVANFHEHSSPPPLLVIDNMEGIIDYLDAVDQMVAAGSNVLIRLIPDEQRSSLSDLALRPDVTIVKYTSSTGAYDWAPVANLNNDLKCGQKTVNG
ncbi:glycosyltransferase [Aquamicrobium sp. LC103]|uniref:glycosyltransferase n=1 Tax=Aquamicrobium sp. LC103 TaxID=1120658 RepID=UPI000A9FA652|nr:glycosyltransferase [Aquamicrobium sp. LC103]